MAYNSSNAKLVLNALISAGAPAQVLPFLMSQVAHETGNFNSRVMKANNNASGIMFINKPLKQKNATRGLPYPKKEGKYWYANFASLTDWARDYLRIVGKLPMQAVSLPDYAAKLRQRGYYTDSLSNYTKGLKIHFKGLIDTGIIKVDPNALSVPEKKKEQPAAEPITKV